MSTDRDVFARHGLRGPPPQPSGDCAARRVFGVAMGALLLVACARQPYPAPTPRAMSSTELPTAIDRDPGDETRVRQMEQQCRARLSGESTGAALGAIDDVRQVLGPACDFEMVEGDPLHWKLQCSADALFAPDANTLLAQPVACGAGRGKAAPWVCVGARLRDLITGGAAPLDAIEVAVVAHADDQPLSGPGDAHVCSGLQTRLGYAPPGPWQALQDDAANEARLFANRQLAWCRSARVADLLRTGLGDAAERVELAVLGMGASWAAVRGHCSEATGKPAQDCARARRVDVLVHMQPRVADEPSACVQAAAGLEGALACLQDCVERVALGSAPLPQSTSTSITNAPLFVDGRDEAAALPAGWYLHRTPAREGRRLAIDRVCALLGVDAAHCGR